MARRRQLFIAVLAACVVGGGAAKDTRSFLADSTPEQWEHAQAELARSAESMRDLADPRRRLTGDLSSDAAPTSIPTPVPTPAPSISAVPTTTDITTYAQLAAAVGRGEAVTLPAGVIEFGSEIAIASGTVASITGVDGTVLSGGGHTRLFAVGAFAQLTLTDLTLVNGTLSTSACAPPYQDCAGPAVWTLGGSASLVRCIIKDMVGWVRTTRAPFSPRARDHHPLPPAVAQNGGIAAIGVSYAPTTINIEDSTFTGSSGFTYGGAVTVSTYTTLTISGTLIEKLDAGQALYACCSPLSIYITTQTRPFKTTQVCSCCVNVSPAPRSHHLDYMRRGWHKTCGKHDGDVNAHPIPPPCRHARRI